MKSFVFIISSLMIIINSFSQSNYKMIKLGTVHQLPMRDAKVFKEEHPDKVIVDYFPAVSIRSKTDSVFSIKDCKVNAVFSVNDSSMSVVAMDNDSIFYSYPNLNKTFLKKRDLIKKGDLIGFAKKDNEWFDLTFMVIYGNGKGLAEEKIWQLIKKE